MSRSSYTLGPAAWDEDLVPASELAHHLRVRRSWVYEATKAGLIPYFRAGRYLRYRVSEVDRALAARSADG